MGSLKLSGNSIAMMDSEKSPEWIRRTVGVKSSLGGIGSMLPNGIPLVPEGITLFLLKFVVAIEGGCLGVTSTPL